jgi:colanic acid/amylovoran biosynthesis glycosyltransferase
VREANELARRGDLLAIWCLLPPENEPPVPAAAPALPYQHTVPAGMRGAAALAASLLGALLRRRRRLLRAAAWATRWAWRERDPRHLAALPYAAYIDRRLPAGAHIHAHFANTPATAAALVAWLGGRTWSFTGHARDLWTATSSAFLAEKASRAAFSVAVSEFGARVVREAIASRGNGQPEIVVVRSGVDLATRPSRDPEPDLIVAVGRLVRKKGFATLIDALALLRAAGAEARLEILGGGDLEGSLSSRARTLGLAGAVRLRGAQPLEEVQAALQYATVLALPSERSERGDSDNIPVALIEALAAGVPVVTTPVGGIPELIRDRETGLLIAPGDARALAGALGEVMRDAALRASLAAGGRAIVEQEFDLRRNVATLARRCHAAAAGG